MGSGVVPTEQTLLLAEVKRLRLQTPGGRALPLHVSFNSRGLVLNQENHQVPTGSGLGSQSQARGRKLGLSVQFLSLLDLSPKVPSPWVRISPPAL